MARRKRGVAGGGPPHQPNKWLPIYQPKKRGTIYDDDGYLALPPGIKHRPGIGSLKQGRARHASGITDASDIARQLPFARDRVTGKAALPVAVRYELLKRMRNRRSDGKRWKR